MEDFTEFFEGTADVGVPGSDVDNIDADEAEQLAWQRHECEVVVCLIDCNADMFFCHAPPLSTRSGVDVPIHSGSTLLSVERDPPPTVGCTSATMKGSIHSSSDIITAEATCAPAAPSFFSMTLRSIRTLLTEKIVWTNKDKVAVVLYNTRECANAACFPGIYVMQEATLIGAEFIQRVEQLEAAGVYGSPAYDDFVKTIGHLPDPALDKRNRDDPDAPACRFSEVLWVARHMLLNTCAPDTVQQHRLFAFTNESDPTQGCSGEWHQCCEQARALADVGATLEVFGFADGDTPNTPGSGVLADLISNPTSAAAHNGSDVSFVHPPSAQAPASCSSASFAPGQAPFNSNFFWKPLLKEMEIPSAQPTRFTGEWSTAFAANRHESRVSSGGIGAVHVHASSATLHQLLSTVARRALPQRPYRNCLLRIGRLIGQDDGGDASSVSAAAAPRMAVSLYTPLLRARLPQHEWLDRQTHQAVRRVVRLHTCKNSAGEGKSSEELERTEAAPRLDMAGSEEVKAGDLCCYAKVGEDRAYFTKEERRRITEVAAGDAEPGFTILLFKDTREALKHAHMVRRSSFLHACVEKGGMQSHRLFVLLVRRLRAKGKAAIAQYRRTIAAEPRLVALVPSPDLNAYPEKRYRVPAEGLGLYVVPLPFAEDLRCIPNISSCTSLNRQSTPCRESGAVDPAHLELAKEVVAALTESYSTDERANPALQRQYGMLQHFAQQRRSLCRRISDPEGEIASSLTEGDDDVDAPLQTVDSTLPDSGRMLSHAHCFHVFNREVLGSDYNAARHCPPPCSAPHAMRRPRTDSNSRAGGARGDGEGGEGWNRIHETVRQAAARNAWNLLTVPLLKEYLSLLGVSVGAARRKADLIALAKDHTLSSSPSK
ncbi:putative KU70 protein [Leptomonas seymouri]|uniref:Putative KU70 protein n=1 Tax=Leptomonas seymouri TaxID=5684 RepID=A0A0N0P8R7_LEPSE|nr:putative KU70 protein [Leptomonas seymouri]|eukprot:KPI89837.1 putative KU70 protein [Leptomonas seymouri]